MIDPASAADWVQASLVTGLVAGLAAAGMRALTHDQHESWAAPSPAPKPLSTTTSKVRAAEEEQAG